VDFNQFIGVPHWRCEKRGENNVDIWIMIELCFIIGPYWCVGSATKDVHGVVKVGSKNGIVFGNL
jgi:hypothetical protein